MEDNQFLRRLVEAGRPGAYLRIVIEGDVGAGDEIRLVERPDHDLPIGDVYRIYTRDRVDAGRLLSVAQISSAWKGWANKALLGVERRMDRSRLRRRVDPES